MNQLNRFIIIFNYQYNQIVEKQTIKEQQIIINYYELKIDKIKKHLN